MSDRLVVVGAGAVGAAVAWVAARDRLAGEVVLVDPDPGSGASRVAGGMLAPISEAWPGEREVLELGAASLALWPGFAEAVAADGGLPVGLRREGTVQVAVDAADVADLDRVVEHLRAWGRDVERCGGRELRRREPALGPAVRAGLLDPRRPRRRQPRAARRPRGRGPGARGGGLPACRVAASWTTGCA